MTMDALTNDCGDSLFKTEVKNQLSMGNRHRNLQTRHHLMQVRPRSSSTRSRLKRWGGQLHRSPSVSPIRGKEVKMTPPTPITPLDQWISSFGGGESYFSTRPPVDPMHVVFTSLPSPNLQPQISVQDPLRITNHSYLERVIYPLQNMATPSQRQNKIRRRNKKFVHDLVHDLVENLPLDVTTIVASTSKRARQLKSRSQNVKEQVTSNTCSIAVQAVGNKARTPKNKGNGPTMNGNGVQRENILENEDAEVADDWVGGMRAMRDSHVRLVLRQLRHIDRLNRALDRAGRAFRATSPRSTCRQSN